MNKNANWIDSSYSTLTSEKHLLAYQSIKVRTAQYKFFVKHLKPTKNSKVLDVGVSSELVLPDSNMFEKLYPYPKNLTLATIENASKLRKLYPKCKVVKITPHKHLPFKDKQFDIAVSWATLEHVGSYEDQKEFLAEMARVSKKFFLTTPYRGCIYEPHSGLFFIHWLPLSIFRKVCKAINKPFWAEVTNLNPLYVRDVLKMNPKGIKLKVKIYKMFNFLPSHLIIYSQ